MAIPVRVCLVGGCVLMGCFMGTTRPMAQETQSASASAEEAIHDELRALREKAVEAFKERDIDQLLECLADDVVVIVQNGEILQGHDGVRQFHQEMSVGEDREVQSQETDFHVDDLSTLYGEDAAVAHGTIEDHFVLSRGLKFDLFSRWTATIVQQDDQWRVASFHVSTNMFDNGVMDLMLRWNSITVGAIALVVGIVATLVLTKLLRNCSSATGNA